ncbi:MAG: recombinase family protein [Candidatus Bathyarchaeota archaeon]|nr:recombinase family protein [Candidatus Termiticorpusculum sp.]
MEIYEYVWVSSKEQNDGRQIFAMNELHIPLHNIFVDKQSGRDFDRSAYKLLASRLQNGDLLYIKSIEQDNSNTRHYLWRFMCRVKVVSKCEWWLILF